MTTLRMRRVNFSVTLESESEWVTDSQINSRSFFSITGLFRFFHASHKKESVRVRLKTCRDILGSTRRRFFTFWQDLFEQLSIVLRSQKIPHFQSILQISPAFPSYCENNFSKQVSDLFRSRRFPPLPSKGWKKKRIMSKERSRERRRHFLFGVPNKVARCI
ncbi:hypothetical protein AVEN_90989-1 [Araneus ventricosus]|uniref:Uncharacterized protein n=1 Tax=Araneus ventricosus TaxID=182803 RepID=A0A4Y2GTQ1_ARAVE|nr:hypothetical protein AVEN_90989-1 [Araneus ventricosus]